MRKRVLRFYIRIIIVILVFALISVNPQYSLIPNEKLMKNSSENNGNIWKQKFDFPQIHSDFSPVNVSPDFIFGADISSYPQVIDGGGVFKNYTGEPANLFDLIGNIGVKWGRLRLWVDPPVVANSTTKYCDLEHTKTMASLFKSRNLSYLLDFHYSDWWADPGQQNKPHSWEDLPFSDLSNQVYNYTYSVLDELAELNALPAMIQTGNEISHGMLWPDGNLANISQFASLLKSCRSAILDFCAEKHTSPIPIMLHIPADNWESHRWFFDSLFDLGVKCDVIGLSYYARWHGNISNLADILNKSTQRYHIPIIIAETNYVHGLYWINPDTGDYWNKEDVLPDFPASPEGQRAFLETLIHLMLNLPEGLGRGIFLWEPAWIFPCVGSTPTQDRGFFDLDNNLLSVYSKPLLEYNSGYENSDDSLSDDSQSNIEGSHVIYGYVGITSWGLISLMCGIFLVKITNRLEKHKD